MTYELNEEKFRDMLGDMLAEEDDMPVLEQVQEYLVEDGCPTDNHEFLMINLYKAYLIFLDLSKEYYQNKIKALHNSQGVVGE